MGGGCFRFVLEVLEFLVWGLFFNVFVFGSVVIVLYGYGFDLCFFKIIIYVYFRGEIFGI